jgi:uncharacterized membrane protein YhfC
MGSLEILAISGFALALLLIIGAFWFFDRRRAKSLERFEDGRYASKLIDGYIKGE